MAEAPINVLLIEDDEDDYILTRQLLSEMGQPFTLEWAREHQLGVEQLCDANVHYDVCLLDFRLGQSDGVLLLREVIARGCSVPVIVLTGASDRKTDLAAMNAGAADFLSKSDVTPRQMERSIRYTIQKRRAEEQRLKLLEEQAARARAEASSHAKDQFMAALSHELRTPLTPVLMTATALLQEQTLPEALRPDLQMIKRNIELEARLIDDLLDLTRIAQGKVPLQMTSLDLRETLRHVLEICRADAAAKQLKIVLSEVPAPATVNGDATRIRQVFWNLLKNAIKFTPEGGSVFITTRLVPGAQEPQQAEVAVRDTGQGIDPAVLPVIFRPFEQGSAEVTRLFGGLGMGLAISKALVELHGGTLTAQSEGKDRGATFTVRLPTTVRAKSASGEASAAGPGAGRVARILLVEDHADSARVMSRLLKNQGYEVHTAGNLAEARAAWQSHPCELIISDIGLPDGSGLDLLRELKALCEGEGKTVPIAVAISGYGMDDDIRRSGEAGFVEHLTKPINAQQLVEAVARILEQHGAHTRR